jgi:alcohol dehydrogenase class IV
MVSILRKALPALLSLINAMLGNSVLEAAAQGAGFDSFSDAVNAYNEQYGTNYTDEEAREALGQ